MTEHEKAKAWRESMQLSIARLSELTGYSIESVYEFERGCKAGTQADIKPWIWHRYKLICAGVHQQLTSGKTFEWGK